MADLTDLLYDPDEAAQQKIRALAAALQGQQGSGQMMQFLGGRFAPIGAAQVQNAQHGQDQLNQVPQLRLKMAMERLQQQKAQQEQDALAHPATRATLTQLWKKYGGIDVPQDTPASVLQHNLPTVEKGFAVDETTAARKDATARADQARKDALDEKAREFDAKAAKAKEIPARQAERYAQLKATIQAFKPYMKQLDEAVTGPVMGRLAEMNPLRGGGTAKAIATGQALQMKLARALHGGVPTKVEIEAAGNYVPGLHDTPEQRTAKHDALLSLFADEEAALKQTYGEVGLNTTRLTTAGPKAPGVTAGTVRVRFNGKTLEIPQADLAEAQKDGAEVIP